MVECGNALLKNGYKLKILNTINFSKSMHYNPFAYVHSEKDILKLVTTLMTNTKGEGSGGDPFWEKSERLLLTALIAYLHYEAPMEEQNFATLLEMLNTMQVLEDDEEYQNPVDLLFEELAKKKPNSFAGRQYKLYKLAAGKTAKSILISCGARLAPFDIQELRDLTMYDELQLDTLGDKRTALFLIMSDTDSTFNFLISMVYTQLFNLLCDKADDVYGGKLPIHVRCLIDECANIGQIPNLEKLVATIRSREISACLVLQARSQLKAIYKDNADTIVGNMDSQIFLGGSEPTTLKDLSEMLGKETIDAFNTSDTRGNSPSYGTTFQKMGHELLSRDELAVLDGGKCILQLRGVRPFLSDKYDLTQHPNYKLTSDYDPKNTFDIEKYLNRKEKINSNDEFVVIDTVKEVRPRYSCFYKIRHPGDCDGQSGYGVSKLDSIVEEVVRQIFAQFREVSRKKLLESVKTNDAARIQKKVKKIQKDLESKQKELDDLKAETILVIRGVSALDKELLGTLVAEAREALETLEKQLVQAQEEYEEATKTAKRSNYICNELFTWADVYDTANHDERRAILQQFITEIRVRKDYEISITLNASFNQVEQLKAVSTYDGAEIFEEISEKGA